MPPRTVLLIGLLLAGGVRAQHIDLSFLPTRPEASGFAETTRYDEAMAFLEVIASASERMHLTTFGYTTEGRVLPLAVFGHLRGATPEEVLASGRTRVFIMANIHAGEVAGKEAMLMLLRALAAGQHAAWADSLVVLVAPLYNADGNERISLYNRPLQHGPLGGMGQRENAQGLDLNRDHMKLETPEARSLLLMLQRYDPHVLVDLHTTNGTHHGYHLTYAPPLHPNTYAPIIQLLRTDWLPTVTRVVDAKYGWDYYYYGNLPWPGSDLEPGWYTFDYRPRFSNNYAGLRNRFAILSEAYAYASFEERISATRYFVEEILNYAHAHAGVIRQIVQEADARSVIGERLALRAQVAPSAAPVEILLGAVVEEKNPYSGATLLRRQEVRRPERMVEYGAFEGTEWAQAPKAYLVPADLAPAVDLLTAHGIPYRTLAHERRLQVERYRIDSTRVAEEAFQGRHERTLFGTYEGAEVRLPAGTLLVPVDQPLGRLVFCLLEPRSDDGLVSWALLDEALEGAAYYPIYRLPAGSAE